MNILKLFFLLLVPTQVFAESQYTVTDVGEHNTTDDCWMIYDEKVYDLTDYLSLHTRFMDITNWCGNDMTEDFQTKAGEGRDHKMSSYSLLEVYYIGDIVQEVVPEVVDSTDSVVSVTEENMTTEEIKVQNPYNLIVPLIITTVGYWLLYFLIKNRLKFNAFWNTVLILTLVIPSFGFGIFMMLRYQFKNLYDINFDFMYWHVELSVVMGVIGINHFIQRFKQYLVQLRK